MKVVIFLLLALATLHPSVESGVAMIAGIVFALTWGNPILDRTKTWTRNLLQISVIGLGFGMDLMIVGKVGAQGMGYTIVTIVSTLLFGWAVGKALGVRRDASLLISSGTAICGGSAIAAIAPAIGAENEDVTVSLATVFLLNAAALFIFPSIGHYLDLSQSQFGLWSALAVHDTSSVVGTSSAYGVEALNIGTTVKLARALWITPIAIGASVFFRKGGKGKSKTALPWFILGFILAAALVTWVPSLQPLGHQIATISRRLLVLTLFFIGANLTMATLRNVGMKPMVQGLILWIVAASSTLFAIYHNWIHL